MTTSGTMTESGLILDLDFPRNTHTLTVDRNTTYISSTTDAGTYRWGQAVGINAIASSNSEFTAWSQTSGTGQGGVTNFNDYTNSSTTFTMPKSNATIYADGKSSCSSSVSGTMQDFNPCSTITATSGTLTDSRNQKELYCSEDWQPVVDDQKPCHWL